MRYGYIIFGVIVFTLIIIIIKSDVQRRLLYHVKKSGKKADVLAKIGIEYKGTYKRNHIIKFHFLCIGDIQGCWVQVLCFRSRIYLSVAPIDVLHPFQIVVNPTYDHLPYFIKNYIYTLYLIERYSYSKEKLDQQYLLQKLTKMMTNNHELEKRGKILKPLIDGEMIHLLQEYIKTYVSD